MGSHILISCLLQVRRVRWGPCFPFLHNHITDKGNRVTFPTLMPSGPALLPLANRITSYCTAQTRWRICSSKYCRQWGAGPALLSHGSKSSSPACPRWQGAKGYLVGFLTSDIIFLLLIMLLLKGDLLSSKDELSNFLSKQSSQHWNRINRNNTKWTQKVIFTCWYT